jgi:hypothetical protein
MLETNVTNMQPPTSKILSSNPLLAMPLKNIPPQDAEQDPSSHLNQPSQQQQPILSISYLLFLNAKNGINNLTNETLTTKTDLVTLTLETLYLLARQLGNKYFVFASMFDKILLKNRYYAKLHEQLILNSRESSFYVYWSDVKLLNGIFLI